jgi:hypothetical protein
MSPWLLQVNFSIFVIVSLSLTYSVPWWSYKLKAGVEESSSWLKSYVWFSRLNHKQVQRIFYLAGSLGKLSFPHHTWCTATPLQSLKGVGVKDLELLPVHTLFFFSYLHFKPRAFIVNLYIHICLRSAVSVSADATYGGWKRTPWDTLPSSNAVQSSSFLLALSSCLQHPWNGSHIVFSENSLLSAPILLALN